MFEQVCGELSSKSPIEPITPLLPFDSRDNPSDARELFARAIAAASAAWPMLDGHALSSARPRLKEAFVVAWGTPLESTGLAILLAQAIRQRLSMEEIWGLAVLATQRRRHEVSQAHSPLPSPKRLEAEAALFDIRRNPSNTSRHREGLERLKSMLKADPYDPDLLVIGARALAETAQSRSASELLSRALLIEPERRSWLASSAAEFSTVAQDRALWNRLIRGEEFPEVKPAGNDHDLLRVEITWSWRGPERSFTESFQLLASEGCMVEPKTGRQIPTALVNALWQDIETAALNPIPGGLVSRLTRTDDEPELLVRIERPRGRIAWLHSSSNAPDMLPINAIGRGRLRLIESRDAARRLMTLKNWVGCQSSTPVPCAVFPGREFPAQAEPTGSPLESAFRAALGVPVGTAAAEFYLASARKTPLPPGLAGLQLGTCVKCEVTRLPNEDFRILRWIFQGSGTAFIGDRALSFLYREGPGSGSWFCGSPDRFLRIANTLETHLTRLVGSQGIELDIFPAIGSFEAANQPVLEDLLESVRTLAYTDSTTEALSGEVAPIGFRLTFREDRLQINGSYLPGNETVLITSWDGLNRRAAGESALLAAWLGLPGVPDTLEFCDLAEGALHLQFDGSTPGTALSGMIAPITNNRFRVEWDEKHSPTQMTIRPKDGDIVMILKPGQPVGFYARRAPK